MPRRLAALFFAVVAAALARAATVDLDIRDGVIPQEDGPEDDLITFFIDDDYCGESVTVCDEPDTGCVNACDPFVNSVSSVKLLRSDISCNLWSQPNCTGSAGIVINGDVTQLEAFNFNDKMVSYNCYSTSPQECY